MNERNPVAKIDQLLSDQYYTRAGLAERPFFAHCIAHTLKWHWAYLEARKDDDEDLRVVWVDLGRAIDALPEPDQTVVRAYAAGYRALELRAVTGQPTAGAILQRGVNTMARFLNGEPS